MVVEVSHGVYLCRSTSCRHIGHRKIFMPLGQVDLMLIMLSAIMLVVGRPLEASESNRASYTT